MTCVVVIRIVNRESDFQQELAKKRKKKKKENPNIWIMGNLHLLIKLVGNYINNNWQWLRMKLIIHLLYEALFGNPLPPPKDSPQWHPTAAAAAVKAVTGEKKLFIMYSS